MGETEQCHTLLTECAGDGTVSWVEKSRDIEDRNSLAKVTRSCAAQAGVTARQLQKLMASSSRHSNKSYAKDVFLRACGEAYRCGDAERQHRTVSWPPSPATPIEPHTEQAQRAREVEEAECRRKKTEELANSLLYLNI